MHRLLSLLVATVLLLAACGGSGRVAATVDGVDITESEVDSLRPGAVTTADRAASDLNLLITTQVVASGLSALGLEVGDEAVAAATTDLIADIEAGGTPFDTFKETNEVTDRLVEVAMFQQVAQELLLEYFSAQVDVTEQEVRNQFDVELQSRSEVCAAHILLAFPTDADDDARSEVAQRAAELHTETLLPGADFAALAEEFSDDPGSAIQGGDLGCASPVGYVAPFAQASMAAEVGVPSEPVETQYGYHIILVNDRTVPEFDDVADEVEESLRFNRAVEELSAWYVTVVNGASVTVNSKFGTWAMDEVSGVPSVRAPTAG